MKQFKPTLLTLFLLFIFSIPGAFAGNPDDDKIDENDCHEIHIENKEKKRDERPHSPSFLRIKCYHVKNGVLIIAEQSVTAEIKIFNNNEIIPCYYYNGGVIEQHFCDLTPFDGPMHLEIKIGDSIFNGNFTKSAKNNNHKNH